MSALVVRVRNFVRASIVTETLLPIWSNALSPAPFLSRMERSLAGRIRRKINYSDKLSSDDGEDDEDDSDDDDDDGDDDDDEDDNSDDSESDSGSDLDSGVDEEEDGSPRESKRRAKKMIASLDRFAFGAKNNEGTGRRPRKSREEIEGVYIYIYIYLPVCLFLCPPHPTYLLQSLYLSYLD